MGQESDEAAAERQERGFFLLVFFSSRLGGFFSDSLVWSAGTSSGQGGITIRTYPPELCFEGSETASVAEAATEFGG